MQAENAGNCTLGRGMLGILAGIFALWAPLAAAQDAQRGKALYDIHCVACYYATSPNT